eukprot:Rmarinus@m.11670
MLMVGLLHNAYRLCICYLLCLSVANSTALNSTWDIVIAHCHESLSWVGTLENTISALGPQVSIFIVEKCGRNSTSSDIGLPAIVIPSESRSGYEGEAYLLYLTMQYHSLADYTVFLQGDPRHCLFLLDYLARVPYYDYLPLSEHFMRFDSTGSPDAEYPKSCFCNIYQAFIADDVCPSEMATYAFAQFSVSRNRILSRPLSLYRNLQTLLSGNGESGVCPYQHQRKLEAAILERLWHVIFGEDPVMDSIPIMKESHGIYLGIFYLTHEHTLKFPRVARINRERSIDFFRQVVDMDASNSVAWYGMARAFSELQQPDKSVRCLEAAILNNPSVGVFHLRLGIELALLYMQGPQPHAAATNAMLQDSNGICNTLYQTDQSFCQAPSNPLTILQRAVSELEVGLFLDHHGVATRVEEPGLPMGTGSLWGDSVVLAQLLSEVLEEHRRVLE